MIEFRKRCFSQPLTFLALSSLPDAGAMYVFWHSWGFSQFPFSLLSLFNLSTLKRGEYSTGRFLALADFASNFIFLQFLSHHLFFALLLPNPNNPSPGLHPLYFYTPQCPFSVPSPQQSSSKHSHMYFTFLLQIYYVSPAKTQLPEQELAAAICLRFITQFFIELPGFGYSSSSKAMVSPLTPRRFCCERLAGNLNPTLCLYMLQSGLD